MSSLKISVNELLNKKSALEEKVKNEIGESVTLDDTEATITEFGDIDSAIAPAILVKENGRDGAVYLHAKSAELVDNLRTGPKQAANYWIIFLRDGQNFRFYGQPSVKYFKRCFSA
ncbi:MAG: hypothetical protein MMC23_009216 [Stictis urceolatum]|nr:hypothetical protein [Stictis urceolata]